MTDRETIAHTFIETPPLPKDMMEGLKRERTVKALRRTYIVHACAKLPLITVVVKLSNNRKQSKYATDLFVSSAYVLASRKDSPSPAHEILIWLPDVDLYGYYLADRQSVFVYPFTSWYMIEMELAIYLTRLKNAVNLDGYRHIPDIFHPVDIHLPALPKLISVRGLDRPVSAEISRRVAESEKSVLCRPLAPELHAVYKALDILYLYLTDHSLPDESIIWMTKSLVLKVRREAYAQWETENCPMSSNPLKPYPYIKYSYLFNRYHAYDHVTYWLFYAGMAVLGIFLIVMLIRVAAG